MKKLSVILTLILLIIIGYSVYNHFFKKEEINPVENTLKEYSSKVSDLLNKSNYLLDTTKIDINLINENIDSTVSCQEIYYSNEEKVLLHNCTINETGNYYYYDKLYEQNEEYNKIYEDVKVQQRSIEKGKLLKELATIDLNLGVENIDNCVTDGICKSGTPFIIQVNDVEDYKFYVLEDDGEKVKLIMNKNLINKVMYAPSDNLEGPTEAISYLKKQTSNWTNIEARNVKIVDDNNKYDDIYENMRATLPTYTDINKLKNQKYLYDNLELGSGYWLSTSSSKSFYAWSVINNEITTTDVSLENLGIRPVITLYKY